MNKCVFGLDPRSLTVRYEYKTSMQLVTIKKASEITGSSASFFKQLLREGKLNRYKINSATFVSLLEFESLAMSSKNHKPG